MTHPQNGRFTRTLVNRLWHRLMGHGIVHPVDAMQSEPWSADLLDFLASDFAQYDYDLKHTLQVICESKAYQSKVETLAKDSDTRPYVYAGPRARRLTAEQFVDAVWKICGAAPAKIDAPVKRGKSGAPIMVRASLIKCDALMHALGRPSREQIVTSRPDNLSTLEAIDLANAKTLSEALAKGAKKFEADSGEQAVRKIYLHALSRQPTPQELSAALSAVGEKPTPQALQDLLWAVFMLPEFQLVR